MIENGSVTTVYENASETTVYENGTTTVYENETTTTLTQTLIQTATVTSINSSITSTISGVIGCPIYRGPRTPLYCVPVIISNSQSSTVSPSTQILLNVNWNAYSSFLAPNVGNVIFADASGNPLYAWCESNCGNSQSTSNVWIRDDAAIQPSSQQLIIMYIFPTSSIQYGSSGYWGAYPTFSSTYGQYDNGPEVFDFYNNFNGSSLCSCLTATPFLGGLYTGGNASYGVSNGLTINGTGAPSGAGYGFHVYLNTPQSYSAIDSNVVATNLPTSVGLEAAYRYNSMDTAVPKTGYLDNGFYSSYSSLDFLCGCGNTLSIHLDLSSGENGSSVSSGPFVGWTGVGSMVWPSTGSEYVDYNGVQRLSGTDSTLTYGLSFADIAFINGLPSPHYMTFDWMRTRNAPPNNVMPSAIFGSQLTYP
jgi:hypothetical protein